MDIIKRVAPAVALLAALSAVQVPTAQSITLDSSHKVTVPASFTVETVTTQQVTKKKKHKPKLCKDNIVRWLYKGGFRGNALRVGWAIVMRESNGNNIGPGYVHFNGEDYGIWQINAPTHPQYRTKNLLDPLKASRITYKMTKGGQDWSAWGIGVTNSGKVYLDSSQYDGIWDSATQYAWIWKPFMQWYSAYPQSCR